MIGAEGFGHIEFSLRTSCGDDSGAEGFGDLDSGEADATSCCVDEDVVAYVMLISVDFIIEIR
jgi:hypothetical protein